MVLYHHTSSTICFCFARKAKGAGRTQRSEVRSLTSLMGRLAKRWKDGFCQDAVVVVCVCVFVLFFERKQSFITEKIPAAGRGPRRVVVYF